MNLLERTLLAESDRETEKLKKAPRGIPDTRSEKQIQSAGVRVLRQLGFKVWNLSQARASNQTAGIADTYVIGHGVCAWIEWKRASGHQSKAQAEFEYEVAKNGAFYILARNEADVIEWARPIVNASHAQYRLPPVRAQNP